MDREGVRFDRAVATSSQAAGWARDQFEATADAGSAQHVVFSDMHGSLRRQVCRSIQDALETLEVYRACGAPAWLELAVPEAAQKEARQERAMRQRCKVCGVADRFDFDVPDDVWEAVLPERFRKRVVCLTCFDAIAASKGIAYATRLRALHFAGSAGSFAFSVVSATDSI